MALQKPSWSDFKFEKNNGVVSIEFKRINYPVGKELALYVYYQKLVFPNGDSYENTFVSTDPVNIYFIGKLTEDKREYIYCRRNKEIVVDNTETKNWPDEGYYEFVKNHKEIIDETNKVLNKIKKEIRAEEALKYYLDSQNSEKSKGR